MQPTHESGKSAAKQFWDEQMDKHPNIRGILSIIGSIIDFFIGGHVVVAIGQKIALTGGVIAETSLLFATVWVTADYTIPDWLGRFMSPDLIANLSSLSQAAFSLLPELILASAVVTTIRHWMVARQNWQSKHWIWSLLYTAPTLTFLALTLFTISSFSSQDGSITHATGNALALRCLAGYFYALLEIVYVKIGKPGEQLMSQQTHQQAIAALHTAHEERVAELERKHQREMAEQARLQEIPTNQLVLANERALKEITEKQEHRLALVDLQQQRMLTAVQEVQNSVPAIDYEALTTNLEARFEARLEAAMRQRISISEAKNEADETAPKRQIAAPKKSREAKKPASQGTSEAASKVLTLRQASTEMTEIKAEAYRLFDTGLSSYQIAPMIGKSPATIQRWIKDRPSDQEHSTTEEEKSDEAKSDANEPAM